MAKLEKVKEINGKKILYKYGGGCWLTILFSLCTIAVPVLLLFVFPFFENAEGVKVLGLDVLKYLFQSSSKIQYFALDVFNTLQWTWIGDIWGNVVIYSMSAMIIIACLFALTSAIMVIVFLAGGKLTHRKGPFTMSVWIFIFVLLFCAFPIVVMIFEMTKGVPDAFKHYMFNVILVGASLVVMIIMYIIYAVFMKDRLYMKDAQAVEDYKRKLAERKSAFPGGQGVSGIVGQPIQIIINTIEGSKVTADDNVINIKEPDKKEKVVKNDIVTPKEEIKVLTPQITPKKEITKQVEPLAELPKELDSIGGHAFAKNVNLKIAVIPENIDEIGASAFANCVNLKMVTIPVSVKKIGYNAFFNCAKLERINYQGSKKQWSQIKRGSNWLLKAGTVFVICNDAKISVDPLK